MKYNLFNKNLIIEKASDIEISPEKQDILDSYIKKVKNEEFVDEVPNYPFFYEYILRNLLGYNIEEIPFEKPTGETRKRVEFALKDIEENRCHMVIELKGQGTDLDKKQSGTNITPVEQALEYAFHEKSKWFVVSDYNEIRIYNIAEGNKYLSFNITDLENEDIFKQFLLIFSKRSHEDNMLNQLLAETVTIETEFENEFYKLYHETRLMLIKELKSENGLENKEAIGIAQKILNRFMFIFFAEDRGLLPSQISVNTISSPIKSSGLRGNNIWESINTLFLEINDGENYEYNGIFGYNGGLFEENLNDIKIRDKIKDLDFFKDEMQEWELDIDNEAIDNLLKPYGQIVNPIFRNLIIISTFDFSKRVDVDILGHIFENSIEDIEKLKKGEDDSRKQDGIYYTPEVITDFICRNTIIPYLSKSGEADTIIKLIEEYSNDGDIDDLYDKLLQIKIIDPACGSGAFLNKSADILLEIHKAIHEFKRERDKVVIETKGGKGKDKIKRKASHYRLDSFSGIVKEKKKILKYNLFGVDLNEESVEITKLSLFLSIFKKDKEESGKLEPIKLPKIDDNIKCGNSLINDTTIVKEKAFDWKKNFKEICDVGFDVVVGNPPYLHHQDIRSNEKEFISKNFDYAKGQFNLYQVMMEKGFNILREKGNFGFIIPSLFLKEPQSEYHRIDILENMNILKISEYGDGVFENVKMPTCVLIIRKDNKKSEFIFREIGQDRVSMSNINPDLVLKMPNTPFDVNLEKLSHIPSFCENLGKYFKVTRGLEFGKKKLKREKSSFEDVNILSGDEIRPFNYRKPKYIDKETYETYKKDSEIFSPPKIMIKETGKLFFASFDEVGILNLRTVYNIKNKNGDIDIKFLLALFNSSLYNFMYKTFFIPSTDIFPKIRIGQTKKFPIYPANAKEQEPIIQYIEEIVKLDKEIKDKMADFKLLIKLRCDIDLIYDHDLFNLGEDDFLIKIRDLGAVIPTKKIPKVKEYFKDCKDYILPRVNKFERHTNEMDELINEMYNIDF